MNEHISEQVDDVKGYVYMGVWMDVHMGFPDGTMLCLVTQLCPTFCDPMDCSLPGSSVLGDSPGKNTGLGCHALLQGILLTQVSNPGLLHCRWILYRLSHQESPRILELPLIPSSGYLPDLGIKPESTALQVDSLPAELPGKPDPPGGASGK